MALITWQPTYSVGVPQIDEQHRALIDIINRLHDVMKKGGDDAGVRSVVDELVSYTRYHFSYEEGLLERSGYPELARHKPIHQAMVAQVEKFRTAVATGGATVPLKLMGFLKDWLTKHILETDMRYKEHLTAKRAA